jgi:uncharacterized protein YqeY
MTLKSELNNAYKEAMRTKDVEVKNILRLVMAAIKQVEVDEQRELDDADTLRVVQKEVKSLKETIADAEKVNNQGLIDEANLRISILEKYLPKALSEAEVDAIVKAVIADTGASSMADMGNVMKEVMARVAGQSDGKTVSNLVRSNLS